MSIKMENPFVFNKFQPICDKIIRHRDKNDVETLYKMVQETEGYYLQNIQQFLLIPLITRMGELDSIKTRPQSDVKVNIIRVVQLVLEKTELRQLHALKTILIVLSKEVYEFHSAQLAANVSEELTISVLQCLETANRRATSETVEEYFRTENSSQICQIMYVILLLLDKSDSREIKLKAIDALMAHLHVDDSSDENDLVLRSQIAGIVFFALPMIWSSLSKLILNDPKIGRRVIERSICALGRIICLIMEDDKMTESGAEEKQLKIADFKNLLVVSETTSATNSTSILDEKEKKRSPEWLRAAGLKLRESFLNLVSLTGHESSNIRKAVGVCCEQWLLRCRDSLRDNLDTFVEILLILSEDEDQEIANYFSKVVEEMIRKESNSLVAIIRELITRHLNRMSRIIHRRSEKEQLTAISLLRGQLKYLPESELILLFSDSKMIELFVLNLLLLVEFNCDGNVELLKEEYAIREFLDNSPEETIQSRVKPWEDFKYLDCRSGRVILQLSSLMKSLRGRIGTRVLIEYLMDLLHSRPANIAETLKILQFVISSCSEEESDLELLDKVLDGLLEERFWNLSFQIVRNCERNTRGRESLRVSEFTEGLYESSLVVKYVDLNQETESFEEEYLISPREAKLNVLVTCVLMEIIPAIGKKLGPERYQKTVFKILFNLLSNTGNCNICIHTAGLFSLVEITKLYNLKGIRELIMNNSDYLMFFVNQSLRQPERSDAALDVISVMLQFCSRDVLGYVEMIVNRLLEAVEKFHKLGNLVAYLKIFGLFLKSLSSSSETLDQKDIKIKSSDEILNSWLEILKPIVEEEDFESENINSEESEDKIPEENEKPKETPKEMEIAKQIMEVALKHISSKNQSEVLSAMETLSWGISVLRPSEDELLPVVHKIWYPLSKRFSDENPVVLRHAFKMLLTLADSAKDFIHRRAVTEVIPTLNKILRESLSVLTKSKDEGGDRFTQKFKLVEEIIGNYDTIIIRLQIQQKHLDDILNAISPYLSSRNVPKILATRTRQFFNSLKSYDGATVHQKLKSCDLPVFVTINVNVE